MIKNRIKIIFAGTPHFSVPSLLSLADSSEFEVMAAITQPDKPVGRGGHTSAHPVKVAAGKKNIPIFQPEKIIDIKKELLEMSPDLLIVVAYSQLLPKEILEIPRLGCLNLHASLLPKYRGSSCIQSPILNGDKITGVTIIKMEEKLDAGPIISQKQINIESSDTTGTLFDRLSVLGAELLLTSVIKYANQEIIPEEQDESKSSFSGRIKKEDGEIDWKNTAEKIERQVRAMSPWPGTFTFLGEEKKYFKIIEVEIIGIESHKPGTIFTFNSNPAIQCGQNALIIKKIQPEGARAITGKEFLNGYARFLKN